MQYLVMTAILWLFLAFINLVCDYMKSSTCYISFNLQEEPRGASLEGGDVFYW